MKGRYRTMVKRTFVLLLAFAFCIAVVPTSRAYAVESLAVNIGESAKLVAGGQAVELKVKVRCATDGLEVLESFVYVVQDGNQSAFRFFTPVCSDNPAMQVFRVRVSALDFQFQNGEATATAFILLINPGTQETTQIEDRATIQIK